MLSQVRCPARDTYDVHAYECCKVEKGQGQLCISVRGSLWYGKVVVNASSAGRATRAERKGRPNYSMDIVSH